MPRGELTPSLYSSALHTSRAGPPSRLSGGFSLAATASSEPAETMPKDVILTPAGLEKLKGELEYLSTNKRREVADRIKAAREFGDIMENSEYDDAKNEQAMLEQRIASLQDRLRRAAVIDDKHVDSDEADPTEQKLSNESPIGKALLGSKRNEVVTVETPRGPKRKLKVTKIE